MFKKILSIVSLWLAIGVFVANAQNAGVMTRSEVDAYVSAADKNISTFRMESRDVSKLLPTACNENTIINTVKTDANSKITANLYYNGMQLVKVSISVTDPRFGYKENIYVSGGSAVFSTNGKNTIYLTEDNTKLDQAVKSKMIALSCNINLLINQ